MNYETARKAAIEARRFLEAYDAYIDDTKTFTNSRGQEYCIQQTPRLSATLKRRSMDLTHALADMRCGR